jgi:hypothetical protein
MAVSVIVPFAHDLQPVDASKNKEDIRLIWVDTKIDDSEDSAHTQILLLEFNPAALFYTDLTRCVDLIKSITDEQILLIVSGALAREVLSQVHNLRHLAAVFIFCRNREYHIELISQYSKIIDVFTHQEPLLQSIRQTMKIVEKQLMAFSLFDQKLKSTRDLSKDSASFLWNQLLLYVLKKLPQDEQVKLHMLSTCADLYALDQQ